MVRLTNRARRRRRRGIAAVEFALVCVPLFALMVGLIDYGWVFLKVQQITQAARAGARAAILADATSTSAGAVVDAWMAEAGIDVADYDYAFTPEDVSAVTPGNPIKCEVTVRTGNLALIRASIVPVPAELHAAASMAKEGP
jgi:Flp pilus assembly protein TadG